MSCVKTWVKIGLTDQTLPLVSSHLPRKAWNFNNDYCALHPHRFNFIIMYLICAICLLLVGLNLRILLSVWYSAKASHPFLRAEKGSRHINRSSLLSYLSMRCFQSVFFVINYASIAYYSYTRESLHTISNEISYRVPNKTLTRHLLFEYLSAVCVSLTQHSHRCIITASENIFSRPARVHRAFWHHCQCPGASAFRTQYFPI